MESTPEIPRKKRASKKLDAAKLAKRLDEKFNKVDRKGKAESSKARKSTKKTPKTDKSRPVRPWWYLLPHSIISLIYLIGAGHTWRLQLQSVQPGSVTVYVLVRLRTPYHKNVGGGGCRNELLEFRTSGFFIGVKECYQTKESVWIEPYEFSFIVAVSQDGRLTRQWAQSRSTTLKVACMTITSTTSRAMRMNTTLAEGPRKGGSSEGGSLNKLWCYI